MKNKYYIAKRYYSNEQEYLEQYWDGSGFSIYEDAAVKYVNVNAVSDIAHMLKAIADIQDEVNVKYVIYVSVDGTSFKCTEVIK